MKNIKQMFVELSLYSNNKEEFNHDAYEKALMKIIKEMSLFSEISFDFEIEDGVLIHKLDGGYLIINIGIDFIEFEYCSEGVSNDNLDKNPYYIIEGLIWSKDNIKYIFNSINCFNPYHHEIDFLELN